MSTLLLQLSVSMPQWQLIRRSRIGVLMLLRITLMLPSVSRVLPIMKLFGRAKRCGPTALLTTGPNNIQTKFIKLVSDHLTSPLTHILNTCISKLDFPTLWKIARISSFRRWANPREMTIFALFSFCLCYQRFMKDCLDVKWWIFSRKLLRFSQT